MINWTTSNSDGLQGIIQEDQVQPRSVALEGGRNFRDVGGYPTADGRKVKWGAMYRSGSLANLTSRGISQLERLGIVAVIDLRSTPERSRDPSNWLAASSFNYWTREYGYSEGDLASRFTDPAQHTVEAVRAMMFQAYRTLPKEQAPAYRELFARLADDDKGAVVVNCTAGKDRTGIGTALALTALGVHDKAIREDFLLSNSAPGMETLQRDLSLPLAALSPEAAAPLLGVESSYLDATFDQLREDYGSIEAFMECELDVGPREIAAIRHRLLD